MGRPQLVTRAAAYLRVSTDKQDLEVQLTEIRQHAGRRGWELVEKPTATSLRERGTTG